MTIDWKKEVEQRQDALLEDLKELLRVKSEREDDKVTPDAPFGPGPRDGLLKMLSFGERDGFTVKNVDNYAGHIEFGEGDETLGIFGHMDVVPAGDGWDTDPYEPVIKDGKIYARGSSDDKGPSMAAYYAMKIIKELNLPLSKKIRFVVGSDEESGWGDMDYYFEHEARPDFGFSPDAEFPIINGEKGNISLLVHTPVSNEGKYQLIDFKSGLRPNMVPGTATAVIEIPQDQVDTIKTALEAFVEANPVTASITEAANQLTIELVGKGAHGAHPSAGINAGTYLALFLNEYDFKAGAKNFLQVAAEYLHLDLEGEKLQIAYNDEKMGELTMNASLFSFEKDQKEATVNLNIRYPQGTTEVELKQGLADSIGQFDVTVTEEPHHMTPHYVPVEDPLVATLLSVYEDHTGEKGFEQIIGGGTYGRLLERGVAYGAMFPGYTDTMHQANEFMELDDLFRSAVIYADAIYRLAK